MRGRKTWTAAAVLGLTLFVPGLAAADISKAACIDANTNGQNFRRDQKLREAREQYQLCSDPKCPEIVRADCVQRYEEIEASMPTVVFDVKKPDGSDAVDVRISVDKQLVAEKADGSALIVNPGAHEVTFELGGEVVTKTFVFKENEKKRTERISFQKAGAPVTPPPATNNPPTPAPAISGGLGGMRIAGITVASIGVITLGVGTIFGVGTIGAANKQEENCASVTNCRNRSEALVNHDDAKGAAVISSIGIISGLVLIAGGAALYLLAPPTSTTTTARVRNPLHFTF